VAAISATSVGREPDSMGRNSNADAAGSPLSKTTSSTRTNVPGDSIKSQQENNVVSLNRLPDNVSCQLREEMTNDEISDTTTYG